jgi:hypothetical protein
MGCKPWISFPNSPNLLKGGIVLIDPGTDSVQRIIALQYNPDQPIVAWAHVQNSDMKKWLGF